MGKQKLTVLVNSEVLKRARIKKAITGRSLSHVVETALREWVKGDQQVAALYPKRPEV